MGLFLNPYSEEWFCALDKLDPARARVLRLILEEAGHDNVCYFCGMRTSQDYVIPARHFSLGIPLTARLCGYCAAKEKAHLLPIS